MASPSGVRRERLGVLVLEGDVVEIAKIGLALSMDTDQEAFS